jgi:predicted MFS family arabinose efflux permease
VNDRLGSIPAWTFGAIAFVASYVLFASGKTHVLVLGFAFVLAGVGIGFAETAQSAAVAAQAPEDLRGSAFGLLAGVQAFGNLLASVVAGFLWTVVSPEAAFIYLGAWMLIALLSLIRAR